MKAHIYLRSANHQKFKELLHQLAVAISYYDEVHILDNTRHIPGADVDIIWGSWKSYRNDAWHNVKCDVVRRSEKFVVLETPLVGRLPTKDVMDDTSYRVGINGFLGDVGFEHTKGSPSDRLSNLGVYLKPWKFTGRDIIVALQLPGDASLQGIDISKWATDVVNELQYQTRKIVVRTPQLPREFDVSGMPKGTLYQFGTAENLQNTLDMAHCVITYSSGFGTDAVINGTPTIAMGPASMVYDLCPNSIDVLKKPVLPTPDREQWLQDISYAQWSQDEIHNGEMWKYLREKICLKS
tara:strand:+ start:1813 stop:2700 length:888 start_codon:yes stop_codon:yes gene_type:complete